MGERAEGIYRKVGTPEFIENYTKNVAPKIEKRFRTVGKWWNKWHDPELLDGKVCPVCVVREGKCKESALFNSEIPLVSKTRLGRKFERGVDRAVMHFLTKHGQKNKSSK